MEPIRSPQNRAVVEAGRLHRVSERKRLGRTLIEGPHLVGEAVRAGVTIHRTFFVPPDADPAWPGATPVTDAVLAKLAGTEHPRGPIAVIDIPPDAPLDADSDLLVLWQISDPGNVGTIIRSAAAFGLAVAIGPETADPWAPKVLRAGAGTHFDVSLTQIDSTADLVGYRLAATVVNGGSPPGELGPGPWAVLIGSEAHGLGPELIEQAESRVSIPMPGGVESLNAAVAASIVAYELGSRRRARNGAPAGDR